MSFSDTVTMRILIGTESFLPRSNGVTNTVARTMRYLKSQGHVVLLLAPGDGPTEFEGQRVIRIPSLSLRSWATVDLTATTVRRIMKVIQEFQPDVVHLASPFLLGAQIRKAANRLDIPTVAVFQTDISGFASFYGLSAARNIGDARIFRIHRKADLTLSPSTHSTNYLRGLGLTQIRQWGRGVDTIQFNPNKYSRSLRKSWGADAETLVIGYVGRLAPEKQVENLSALQGLEDLLEKNIKIIIIGDGPSKKKLQQVVPQAKFIGSLHGEKLGQAMASFDVLVTTGENETFCQVVQEGMASAVPVVSPYSGGPMDLIQDGENGFFYSPGDKYSLRRAILRIAANPNMRKEMGRVARNSVKSRTWENVCSELLNHYNEVIQLREKSNVS